MTEVKEKNESSNKSASKQIKQLKLQPGMTVKVHQKIKDINAKGEEKERIQVFEGMVLGVKKPNSPEGTFTVRKVSQNVGVEKIFPLNSPLITKIDIIKKAKISQSKLYYLRNYKKRLKEKKVS